MEVREFFVEVFLKLIEHDRISFFVEAICLLVLALQLVVRQVNIEVVVVQVEFLTASSQVSFSEDVEIKLVGVVCYVHQAKDPYIELSLLE